MKCSAALIAPTAVADLDDRAVVQAITDLSTMAGYTVVASASGTAPATVRTVILTGELPRREAPRRALVAFAQRNVGARQRRDLVFV